MRYTRYLSLLLVVVLLSLSPTLAQQADDDTAAIEALAQQWGDQYNQNNMAAVPDLYTEDAIFYDAFGVAHEGGEAIQTAVQGFYDGGATGIRTEAAELEVMGDVAHTIGRYTFLNAQDEPIAEGRYIFILRRVDGEWKIYRHLAQRIAPPAAAPAAEGEGEGNGEGEEEEEGGGG